DPPLQVGLIASEKQAIDATLQSLHAENPRVCPIADRYWSARGGSHTDGGAFAFTLQGDTELRTLVCTDKFGRRVTTPADQWHNNPTSIATTRSQESRATPMILRTRGEGDPDGLGDDWQVHTTDLARWNYGDLAQYCQRVLALSARGDRESCLALAMLTRLRDSIWDPGSKRRASVLAMVDKALLAWFEAVPVLATRPGRPFCRVNWAERRRLRPPKTGESTLVIDVSAFAAEGEDSAARFLVAAYQQGWCHLLTYGWRGQRFCGCGLGPSSERLRIEVYGSSGDYLGSGLDGAKVYVHGSAQDQVGQILKHGKLVVYGDVGQTFMYGAKGGEAYVLGNAAGRPLINAAGRPKVVINGTCLDYLAESFMAGDPLRGGGFVLLNGVAFDDHGRMVELPTPYPGGNLFSLASGGAIYIRDPHRVVDEGQLNGGRFVALTPSDWALTQPYLEENARLFGIGVGDLLTTDGALRTPQDVYRKVAPATLEMLT
ncbi:MAG: glutamate synthase, partial [Chloroflexi bacterium]|nr:glutamate synthase [Chloroflexota bacterium]